MTPGYIIVKNASGNSVVKIFLRDSATLDNVYSFFKDRYAQTIELDRHLFYTLVTDRYRESLPPEERPTTIEEFMESTVPESERYIEYSRNDYDSHLITVRNPFANINTLASNIVYNLVREYSEVMNADAVRIVSDNEERDVPYTYTVEVLKDHKGYNRPHLTAESSAGIEFSGFISEINVIEDSND